MTDVMGAGTTRRILFCGDSRCSGATSIVGPCTPGWFANAVGVQVLLAGLLGSAPPVQRGLVIPTSVADARWTIGSNWAFQAGGNAIGWAPGTTGPPSGGSYFSGNGATGTLTFSASGINCDTFDVYFLVGTGGLSTASANFSGGAGTALPVNAGPVGIGKVTVSGTAGTSNTCNIVLTGAGIGPCAILGVEPRLSTAVQLLLGQAGVNGGSARAWNTTASTPAYGSAPIINAYAPDLIVWELGLDDALIDFDSVGTFIAALDSLVNATVGYSKSIALPAANVNPTVIANAGQLAAQYMAALMSWANQHGVPIIDQYDSWGGLNAYALLNPVGYYNADGLHMTTAGYNDQARLIAQALAGLTGAM